MRGLSSLSISDHVHNLVTPRLTKHYSPKRRRSGTDSDESFKDRPASDASDMRTMHSELG